MASMAGTDPPGGVDPQPDIVAGVGGQRQELGDQHGPVVIVECAVEYENSLAVQVFA